jgi:hypothetical protein
MGLQNKGCWHSDVQNKKVPKQAFFGELKEAKNITPTGSPLGHPVEGHP